MAASGTIDAPELTLRLLAEGAPTPQPPLPGAGEEGPDSPSPGPGGGGWGVGDASLLSLAAEAVTRWWRLDQDPAELAPIVARDPVLGELLAGLRGARAPLIPSPFECLVWAILGQQITVAFAYKMKRALVERYGGEVPGPIEDLVTLPGVGRKTANVVRSVALDLPGFPVDTHVGRLVKRLDITQETDPVKVERVVDAMVPAAERGRLSLRVILHGRRVCSARSPACGAAPSTARSGISPGVAATSRTCSTTSTPPPTGWSRPVARRAIGSRSQAVRSGSPGAEKGVADELMPQRRSVGQTSGPARRTSPARPRS